MAMTKIASKPPSTSSSVQKSTPAKVSGGAAQSSAKTSAVTSGSSDVARVSKEASTTAAGNSGVGNLISGLMDWGGTPTADAGKQAAEIKPLELDKGQFLRRGASGDKVSQLQEMLNSKGAKLDVDGKFGPKTLEALKKFQQSNELGVDGVVGPKTLEKLNGAAAEGKATDSPDGKQVEPPAGDKSVDQTPGAEQGQGTDGTGKFANTREALNKLPEKLSKYADAFQAAGEKYGVDPRFLAAISMHETGNGTSSAFRNKNNAMGISGKGGPKHISSVEESINIMARTLAKKDGYYKGKNTIGEIGKVYAPSGATNDPTGLNAYWAGGVAKNFKMFGGDPLSQVVFR